MIARRAPGKRDRVEFTRSTQISQDPVYKQGVMHTITRGMYPQYKHPSSHVCEPQNHTNRPPSTFQHTMGKMHQWHDIYEDKRCRGRFGVYPLGMSTQLKSVSTNSRLVRKIESFRIPVSSKTLIEMWITDLDRVSANSEKGRGSEWAVRVRQRLSSTFGQSGPAREMNLVQIVVEASAIRRGFAKHSANTACIWLVLLAAFWWTIERG